MHRQNKHDVFRSASNAGHDFPVRIRHRYLLARTVATRSLLHVPCPIQNTDENVYYAPYMKSLKAYAFVITELRQAESREAQPMTT